MARRGKSPSKQLQIRQLFLDSVEALAQSPDQLAAAANVGLDRVFEQLVHQACEEVGEDTEAFVAALDSNPELREEIEEKLAELFSPASLERARKVAVRRELERHLQVLRYVLSGIEPSAWIWEAMGPDEQRRLRGFRAAGGEDDPELLARVEQAIRKMEAGTYGTCESCQKPILLERLQLLPWAERCTGCQREVDAPPPGAAGPLAVPVTMFFEGGRPVPPEARSRPR